METRIILTADYHTHTIYSSPGHAKGTMEENVLAALDQGLETIGISDHGPGHLTYGLPRKKLGQMREEIDRLQALYPQINILLGVEANLVSYGGDIDISLEERAYFDYLNLGYHSGVAFRDLRSYWNYHITNRWARSPRARQRIIKKNTDALIRAIEQNPIKIITHPGDKVAVDIGRLAQAAKKTGTILEINNYHPHLSVEAIRIAHAEGASFSLGSDAHEPARVGQVDQAIERLLQAGIPRDRVINIKEG